MKSDFVKCGILGWCIEIIWTAFHGIKNKNNKFIGYTSIIMFPIYGLASVIKPISLKLKKMKMPTIIRGILYVVFLKKCLTQKSAGNRAKQKNRK